MSDITLRIVAVGMGATAIMDAWGLLLRHVYGVAGLDYRLVGRWIGHLPRGRFRHDAIGKSSPVRGEGPLGWVAHYAIGVVFAAGLVAIQDDDWLRDPTLLPALLAGLITVAAPWLVMQPGFGMGVAAARTPNPTAARLRSLITHLVFGLGLYAAGRVIASI